MLHPALRTPMCTSLNIAYPVMQSGMGFVARGDLAAAVSKDGGLGTIGAATMRESELREEIVLVQRTTDQPFAVDLIFAKGPRGNVSPRVAWTR